MRKYDSGWKKTRRSVYLIMTINNIFLLILLLLLSLLLLLLSSSLWLWLWIFLLLLWASSSSSSYFCRRYCCQHRLNHKTMMKNIHNNVYSILKQNALPPMPRHLPFPSCNHHHTRTRIRTRTGGWHSYHGCLTKTHIHDNTHSRSSHRWACS